MRPILLAAALLLAGATAVDAGAVELTPQEKRGQQIYRTGESPSGTPITALVGEEAMPVPATVMPCGSCHGRDGRGRDEGGLRPSNLQWDVLTKPYEVPTPGGRTYPPYTKATLRRAITTGLDPARQKLHTAMPRYQMSLADVDDLVAYLARIGSDRDPGLTDEAIRLGVLLPPPGNEREAVRETLTNYFARITLFGRRIELRFDAALDDVFAIAAAYIVGRDEEVAAKVAEKTIPTIAAFSIRGPDADRYLFHLLPRLEEQSLALIRTLPEEAPLRIEHDASTADVAARLVRHLGARVRDDATNVLYLKDDGVPANATTVLVPALFASPAILQANARIALPSSMQDESGEGTAELRALAPNLTHRTTRASALAAAKLMVRALERAGRDVDREALVDVLESFRDERTGLVPPVTWLRNRHVGTSDCTILRVVEGKLVPFDARMISP